MEKKVIRLIFILTGIAVGIWLLPYLWFVLKIDNPILHSMFINGLIGAIIFWGLSFVFYEPIIKLLRSAEKRLNKMSVANLTYGSIGLLVGLILANIISIPLYQMENVSLSIFLPMTLMVIFGYIGIRIGTRRSSEWNKFLGRRKGSKSKDDEYRFYKYKILDTSAIIDGRIYSIAQTGFLEGILIIPNFVVSELQLISDSDDDSKRERGRRGLDMINTMKSDKTINVQNYAGDFDDIKDVDHKLLKLAQLIDGEVVTTDYNLNKVAEFEKVPILNVNELSRKLKPEVIPGEEMEVKIVKAGTERNQGVAYLQDGTMVVVEEGKFHINETVKVVVTSSLQTDAGKMIFADLKDTAQDKKDRNDNSKKNNSNKKK